MKEIVSYREKEFQKDVYILEPFGSGFLINDAYKGLELLNEKLETIKKIRLFNDVLIYAIFTKFNEEFLFIDCSDNQIFLRLDMKDENIEFFDTEITDITFLPGLYSWKNQLILTTGNNQFFFLDPRDKIIKQVPKLYVERQNPVFMKFCYIAKTFQVIRYYPEKYQFIFSSYPDRTIGLYSMVDNKNTILKYDDWVNPYGYGFSSKHFDAQYINNIFILISENSLEIRSTKKKLTITSPDNFSFIRAVPFMHVGEIHLTVLVSNKSNPNESILKQYKINRDYEI